MDATTNALVEDYQQRLAQASASLPAARRAEEPPAPPGMPSPVASVPRRGTGLEIAAVVLLTAGSSIPFVGWLAGAVLLWVSGVRKWWEKLLGTLVRPLGVTLFVLVVAAPFVVDGFLLVRARRRVAPDPSLARG